MRVCVRYCQASISESERLAVVGASVTLSGLLPTWPTGVFGSRSVFFSLCTVSIFSFNSFIEPVLNTVAGSDTEEDSERSITLFTGTPV